MEHRDVYLNFVNGQWKQGSSGQWDTNRNPSKPSENLGKATRSTTTDTERAIEAAAHAQTEWARRPRPARGALLAKTAQILRAKVETYAKTITREQGKNLNEARAEILKTVQILEFYASEARRPTGETLPSETPHTFVYTTRAPLGVVGLITSWTAPMSGPTGKLAPALLEGNSVVLKPSSLTPSTATLLIRAFEEAGFPPGVVNLVYGSGETVGQTLVSHPKVRALSFTGSNATGLLVHSQAAKRMMRVQLEMGAKNPVLVAADADLDLAVEATVTGAFACAGQQCTATSRVIVERPVYEAFREKLVSRVRALKVGDGLLDAQAMGPLIDEAVFNKVLETIDQAQKDGAKILCGGERVGVSSPDTGYFVAPTVFEDLRGDTALAREEVSGPILVLIPAENLTEAFKIANSVEYGLASSIYTRDLNKIMQYAEQAECGVLHVNCSTLMQEAHAPSGGMKTSSLGGRELGRAGADFYCELKTVYLNYNS